MSDHHHRVALACERCDEIFTRRLRDALRAKGCYCSKGCQGGRGRTMVPVTCAGCGKPYRKIRSEVLRCNRNFCSRPCYQGSIDMKALERRSREVQRTPAPAAARFLRAQAAGLARGRNLSPERLREIAMMGVAARLERRATKGPYRSPYKQKMRIGLDWVGPLLMREETD